MNKKTSPKKVRKISPFLCQEMMYDYVTDNLDEERRLAMDEFIIGNTEAKNDMLGAKGAIDYCGSLGKTKLSQPLYQEISEYRSFWGQFNDRFAWSNWPEYMRWATEALVLSALVGIIAILIPWDLVGRWIFPEQPTVALIEKTVDQSQEIDYAETENQKNKNLPDIQKSDSSKDQLNVVSQLDSKKENNSHDANKLGESIGKKLEENKKTQESAKKEKAVEAVVSNKPSKPVLNGELYRSYMSVENLDEVTVNVVGLIKSLGGEKAGRVQLGWPKPNSSYFHFSIPIKNYEVLVKKLNDFGRLKIYKYPHGRVMPEGQRRIILEIKRTHPVSTTQSDDGETQGDLEFQTKDEDVDESILKPQDNEKTSNSINQIQQKSE